MAYAWQLLWTHRSRTGDSSGCPCMDIHGLNCMISGSQLEMNMDSFERYWGAESLQMVPELLEVASLLWLR